ncbi:DUF1428 domain-containing protein [Puniceibacterium sp. IMCC21224]|uniref:DUF1428 domain-containing protein n=1 Tax=Puniceibacterium sp. IMCC21224 TaxID=1618204 RepID=UPI00064DA7C7|nr:DUF1428 domain-containing protein [Puniceibacterium sp. IMCC21224]KMK68759.1 hypothetical protein IMCC21224_113645 [Puniceibacterium sp. IMCC21224]
MTYFCGCLIPVPTANKAEYKAMSEKMWAVFSDLGCLAQYETWGVDTPDGEVTSFPMAVQKKDDETVVLSWLEWPDRDTCDTGMQAMMSDPRITEMGPMPFDGKRMIWGGFEELFSTRKAQ